jgi:hypothetical protein
MKCREFREALLQSDRHSALLVHRDVCFVRTVGWVAHWQEMVSQPGMRIGRPRELYTGHTRREPPGRTLCQ